MNEFSPQSLLLIEILIHACTCIKYNFNAKDRTMLIVSLDANSKTEE